MNCSIHQLVTEKKMSRGGVLLSSLCVMVSSTRQPPSCCE